MSLKFTGAWRFDSPGRIPDAVANECFELIGKIATLGDRQSSLEHFKAYFANAAGRTSSWSSSESWAETDLRLSMEEAAANAPLFIEAFYDACEALRKDDEFAAPEVKLINRVLAEHSAGYQIRPPNLVRQGGVAPVPVPETPPSLDEQARDLIQRSLSQSEQLLSDGLYRQAVQEVLWLLETVSTAFQGVKTDKGTVQGKYFNKIVADLRRRSQGNMLDQVLDWMTTLHGYLSSPTGGGIRHGTDLKVGVATQANEARLLCNLIRSYLSFLLVEYERLTKHR
jgi:hypothetical protein